MTQSFNIPDSISPEALQEHLENAVVDEPINDLPEDLFDQAEHWVQQASSNSDSPMIVHKLMIVAIVDRMIQFHERVAERMDEEGDGPAGDAFQAQTCWKVPGHHEHSSDNRMWS